MLKRVVIVLSVLTLAAFVLAGYSFQVGHSNACARTNTSLDVLRDILLFTQPPPARLKDMTAEQRAQTAAFYAYAFDRIAKARC